MRDESGFTLMEVLVSATVGTVLMLALLGIVDATQRVSSRTNARSDSGMRGRNGLEQMVQALRGSVCVKQATTLQPIGAGTSNQLDFYADIAQPVGSGTDDFAPQKWQLKYDPATKLITETKWTGTGTYDDAVTPLDFTGVTPTTRTVLANVRAQPGIPIFSYYAYSGGTPPDPYNGSTPLPTTPNLSPTDLASVALIRIAFTVGPLTKGDQDPTSDSSFDEIVRLRQINPNVNPTGGVQCEV